MDQQPQLPTEDANWRSLIRKHWLVFGFFTTAAFVVVFVAIYVFTWFTANAQATNLVPSTLNLWTMNNAVTFIIYSALWELAVVGIPIALVSIAGWQWWKHLPEYEKAGLEKGKHSKGSRAGGAISPLLFIIFALKVYFDGNWNKAIASWTLDYVVNSMVTIIIWLAAIFAIPVIIGVICWLNRR